MQSTAAVFLFLLLLPAAVRGQSPVEPVSRGDVAVSAGWLADEAGIRVKPATRVPEPSRRIAYDQIERIERKQDHVSVGKYVGIGSAIGAGVLLLLLAGV